MMKRYNCEMTCFCLIGCLLAGLCGCQKRTVSEQTEKTKITSDTIVLHAVSLGDEPQYGMDEFYEQLDDLTMRDLGCIVRYDYIPWGEEKNKLTIAISSGQYDLLPAGNFSDFKTTAQKNAYADLNPYLSLVPDLVSHYSSNDAKALEKCEIGGKLYGIPQYQKNTIVDFGDGFFYREDLRKKWNLDPITDLDTMEAYLYRAKEEEVYKNQPLITDNRIWRCLWYLITKGKYLELVNSVDDNPFVVVTADNLTTPMNRFETEEMKTLLDYVRKWYKDGIIDQQILGLTDNEGSRGVKMVAANQKPCETNSPIWAIQKYYLPVLLEEEPEWEYGYFIYGNTYKQHYINSMANSTVICVTEKSKHKELAIQYLEKIHTDETYYKLINYGVEGIHYHEDGDNMSLDGIDSKHMFTYITGAGDETFDFETPALSEQWEKDVAAPYREKCIEIEKTALQNPLTSFTLNTQSITKCLSELNDIYTKNIFPMLCGINSDVDENLAKSNKLLYDHGLQELLDEVGRQLSEYKE